MAMDALRGPTNKVSAWLKQLDDLSDQNEGPATLAAKAAVDGPTPGITSLRSNDWTGFRTPEDDVGVSSASESMPNNALRKDPPEMTTEPSKLAAAKRQKRSRKIIEPAAEGAPPEKRSRNMIHGYYNKNMLDGRIGNEENDLEEPPSPRDGSTNKGRPSALYPTPPPSLKSKGAEDSSLDLSVEDDTEKFEAAKPEGRSTHLLDAEASPGITIRYRSTQHMSPGNPGGWVVYNTI